MNIAKRLEALEDAAKKAEGPERLDVIRVIVAPDRSITGAMRRIESGTYAPVSVYELATIRGCAAYARAGDGFNHLG